MGPPLVLNKVVSSVEALLVPLAGQDGALVRLGAVDFAFVAFEAALVAEVLPVAGRVVAVVGPDVLVLVSPAAVLVDVAIRKP